MSPGNSVPLGEGMVASLGEKIRPAAVAKRLPESRGNTSGAQKWQDNISLESSPTGRHFLRLQLTGN